VVIWEEISSYNRDAFSDNYRNYILTKTIGVYTLNLLLLDYIKLHEENPDSFLNIQNISDFVKRIKGFNWTKESSPLAAFGGMKGVAEARIVLLNYMGYVEITEDDNDV